jgi:transcriptional regulator of arginine metabolism
VGSLKRLRQGQILKLVAEAGVSSQDDLRRRLAGKGVRVAQATLSRDLQELRLVKTAEGYRTLESAGGEAGPHPPLGRVLREFLLEVRVAQNLLVLKAPPGGAQPLAAALDSAHLGEVVGTIAGDDTVLVITPSRAARSKLTRRMKRLLR